MMVAADAECSPRPARSLLLARSLANARRTLRIPFHTAQHAAHAKRALDVDREVNAGFVGEHHG
jgi:hypothetical protein